MGIINFSGTVPHNLKVTISSIAITVAGLHNASMLRKIAAESGVKWAIGWTICFMGSAGPSVGGSTAIPIDRSMCRGTRGHRSKRLGNRMLPRTARPNTAARNAS